MISPCVDSGGDSSEAYDLDLTWTRTDSVTGSSVVDLGYHHGCNNGWQSNPQWPEYNQLRIYPNPTPGPVTVVLTNETSYSLLEIYDLIGRRIFTKNINENGQSITVDISGHHTSEIYFVRVSGENSSLTGRITILNR